jgi:hypothetical protein
MIKSRKPSTYNSNRKKSPLMKMASLYLKSTRQKGRLRNSQLRLCNKRTKQENLMKKITSTFTGNCPIWVESRRVRESLLNLNRLEAMFRKIYNKLWTFRGHSAFKLLPHSARSHLTTSKSPASMHKPNNKKLQYKMPKESLVSSSARSGNQMRHKSLCQLF